MVGRWTRLMRSITPSRAVMMTLGICQQGARSRDLSLFVHPTRRGCHYQVYDAISNGARGLNFYGAHICLAPADVGLGWNWKTWSNAIRPVLREIAPGSPLHEALVRPGTGVGLRVGAAGASVISAHGDRPVGNRHQARARPREAHDPGERAAAPGPTTGRSKGSRVGSRFGTVQSRCACVSGASRCCDSPCRRGEHGRPLGSKNQAIQRHRDRLYRGQVGSAPDRGRRGSRNMARSETVTFPRNYGAGVSPGSAMAAVGAPAKERGGSAFSRRSPILPARARLLLALAPLLALGAAGAGSASAASLAGGSAGSLPGLGPNVIVFDPSMPVSEIQATVDAIHAQQVDAEMSTNRYAFLFKPAVHW